MSRARSRAGRKGFAEAQSSVVRVRDGKRQFSRFEFALRRLEDYALV